MTLISSLLNTWLTSAGQNRTASFFPDLKFVTLIILALLFNSNFAPAQTTGKLKISLTLAPEISESKLSGRLYIMFDKDIYSQPVRMSRPSKSNPWFAAEVIDWKRGSEYVFKNAVGFPYELNEFPEGDYLVQAVLDIDNNDPGISNGPGNFYSKPIVAFIHEGENIINIILNDVIKARPIVETPFLKEVKLKSDLLTQFHGKPTYIKAAVFLPPSYYHALDRKYATLFAFPGFESPYENVFYDNFQSRRYGMNMFGEEKLCILLDLECDLGCHEYANSANSGPWGDAFIQEFLPYIEKEYRVYSDHETRFLTGQSSGAWASLWLQINYPDQFGGAWALSPDPVDFRSFIGVNIYEKDANFFYTSDGEKRDLNIEFSAMDEVFGIGWALSTFGGVFSQPGTDGLPRKLWDRETGAIDSSVASTWKKFDISLVLRENWKDLADKLSGKIHIFVAENDPYKLCPPVKLLGEALSGFNHDIEINIIPEGGHNLWTTEMKQRIHNEMDEAVRLKFL